MENNKNGNTFETVSSTNWHKYDIETKNLLEDLKEKYEDSHIIVTKYKEYVNLSKEIPVNYNKERFIITKNMESYDLFFAFKLLSVNKENIELILNYHVEINSNNNIDIVKRIEFSILVFFKNMDYAKKEAAKRIKIITKWILKKQKNINYYNQTPINKKEQIISDIFNYYYDLQYKENTTYFSNISISPTTILSSYFVDKKNTANKFLVWNANLTELTYIIFFLANHKNETGNLIFTKEELIKLILEIVKDKNNNKIIETTISKYFRVFFTDEIYKEDKSSKIVQKHLPKICKALNISC